ncbi:MAG: phosphoenolpyruvate--protein phosphotransferase [Spirochaetes bacterium]|nr:phosphoenolpyruvate--protein phosphotransferase [Spirochaetota bacterium]MBN2769321.1 phosphoenolpyruvate--protein phosphotransferase [Spirochaetota bacterium]
MPDKIIRGITASPGIRIGKAFLFKGTKVVIPKYHITDAEIQGEIERFEDALAKTKKEIVGIQSQVARSLTKDLADIFTSHLMVLEDPMIEQKAIDQVRDEKKNVEWILNDISLELIKSLDSIEDDYLRERILDISDIHKRLIANLQEVEHTTLAKLDEEVIVFAAELTPSDTALLDRDNVLAFVTNAGGKTSHTAIIARALEIPAIVGTRNGTSNIKNGDRVIVDGVKGIILVNPTKDEIRDYVTQQQELLLLEHELSKLTHLPSVTLDDTEIKIFGNIELPEEMSQIQDHGAEGIGLYRSEFLFMDSFLSDEETQYQQYMKVVNFFYPASVTIRTIDVGGDKVYGFTEQYKERNPFLGCRAIRFSLANEDMFRTQLRAILRASHKKNVKLMFPMISTVEEIIWARKITNEIKDELRKEKKDFDENIQLGIMIEVPSAAINSELLAKYSDFFSVGTNDLVQYTLAVDRIGEQVAYLYNPVDLSVLKMLQLINESSIKKGVPVSVCGEIAGEPLYTMVLLGLGFRTLSMASTYMYPVKRIIRSVTIKECEELVDTLMNIETTSDADSYLQNYVREKFPNLVK